MHFRWLFIFVLLGLGSCQQSALMLHQQKISPTYLASTNVGSPDPSLSPNGQMIIAEWWLARKVVNQDPVLKLHILFKDFSEKVVEYPICSTVGYQTYSVLNDEFEKTGGFLSYHAEIVSPEGDVYANWKHQLWVQLITP